MDISGINGVMAQALTGTTGVGGAAGAAKTAAASGAAGGFDFSASLDAALKAVSSSQNESTELQKQFQLENPNVSLEQTMVAMNKSALEFSAAVQVRNRLVQAYDTVMSMQI